MPYCPKCGKQVSQTARFCKACGFEIDSDEVEKTQTSDNQSQPTSNEKSASISATKKSPWKGNRIAVATITLICGIILTFSVWLPWYQFDTLSSWSPFLTVSGFDSGDYFGHEAGKLVLGGGIFMAIFALSAIIVSLVSKEGSSIIVTLGILATFGALLAIGGFIWFRVDLGAGGFVLSGAIISIVTAVVGFIFAILIAVSSKRRQRVN